MVRGRVNSMLALLDNTVLSNFASTAQITRLSELFGDAAATTPEVLAEFHSGVAIGRLPDTDLSWLTPFSLRADEQPLYQQLLRQINSGEASCLAIAYHRQGSVLTDDRDARKIAQQRQIPVSGTVGILVRLVRTGKITSAEGNAILSQMILKGYHSPVDEITALIL